MLDAALMTVFALGASAAALPQRASAQEVTPPPVPAEIQVEAGNVAFLEGHAIGTQNYVCAPSGNGVAWTLFTPQATLFDGANAQLTTHFFGPNPRENGTVRAAWQHSGDTSSVWGKVNVPSSDPDFVLPNAIPWLLIEVVGSEDGPTGGDTLSSTTFIQRVNTFGGAAPSTGCDKQKDVGKKVFVPYTADYVFYRHAD